MTELTKKELAELAGYTYQRMYVINDGLPEDEKLFVPGNGRNKYQLGTFIQRWVKYNVRKVNANIEGKTLEEIKAIHEGVKTQKTELEVARMRGQLVDVGDVRRMWGDIAATVTQNMIRLPSKIAPQVVAMNNTEIIAGIIDKEVRDVLTAIADTPIPDGVSTATVENDEDDDEE